MPLMHHKHVITMRQAKKTSLDTDSIARTDIRPPIFISHIIRKDNERISNSTYIKDKFHPI